DAVIAAWLSLETAIAAAGVQRRPSQTTLEFVVDVLGSLELEAEALDRLPHLYRRALFDDQPLVEGDRDEALARLDPLTDGLDAVIAAWLSLETAIAAAGVQRRPSQTTLEFVVDVLGSLELEAEALDRLAHLYRRALFDDQPLVEGDRDEALARLDTLTDGLDARAAREAR